MRSIVTSNYYGLILFLWIASVLTSPANHEAGTDGTPPLQVSSATSESPTSTNITNSSIMGEGGPISLLPTTQHKPTVAPQLTSVSKSLNTEEYIREKGSNYTFVTEKSIQSKIYPRKGATQDSDVGKTSSLSDKTTTFNDTKPVVELTATTETVHINEERTNVDANSSNTNAKNSSDITNVSINPNDANIVENKIPTSTTLQPSSTTRRHKPKPTATIGDGNDKPIPASPAKSPPLGMPRKIDYIVPVVITIISVPLLGTATFMLYRRGRDCWDKRHYRRMDFLIDGMYND